MLYNIPLQLLHHQYKITIVPNWFSHLLIMNLAIYRMGKKLVRDTPDTLLIHTVRNRRIMSKNYFIELNDVKYFKIMGLVLGTDSDQFWYDFRLI